MARRDFGSIETTSIKVDGRAVKRYQARFQNPAYGLHPAEPKRISKTFDRHTDAAAYLRDVAGAIQRGEWRSPREEKLARTEAARRAEIEGITFAEYAEPRLNLELNATSTRRSDRSNYDNHLKPYWGNLPIRSIRIADTLEWVSHHLSPTKDGARKHAYDLFKTIMRAALEDQVIEALPYNRNTNRIAYRKTDNPSHRHDPRALTAEEINAFIECINPAYRTVALFAALTGMRLGEYRELRRCDIDLENRIIHLTRNATGEGEEVTIKEPKTKAGIRDIPMSATLCELIETHLEEQGKRPQNALIFPSRNDPDKHMNPKNLRRAIAIACKKAGIPHCSPHDMRNTFASLAGQQEGISPVDIKATLGHEKADMTLRYMRTNQQQQQRIANGVAAAVLNAPSLNVTPLRKAQ